MPKPTFLYVLTSSCQMYSGTGTVVFDWVRYARDTFDFSILIDSQHPLNVEFTARVCRELSIPLYISAPLNMPGCADSGVRSVAQHLSSHSYDFIECISWANAAANGAVLAACPSSTRLLFSPFSQPLWTLGSTTRYFMTSRVFRDMIQSAHATFVLSRSEVDLPEFEGADASRIHYTPGGVDVARFRNMGTRKPWQVLCVCDFREGRKRVDLLFAAFEVAVQRDPRLRLVLAGKESDVVALPEGLKACTTRLGYVSSDALVRLYQESSLLTLLSDYEAFGLPIAEALCCGTPVLLNDLVVLKDLFAGLPGVYWTRNTDRERTAETFVDAAAAEQDHQEISDAASALFSLDQTFGKKREVLWSLL